MGILSTSAYAQATITVEPTTLNVVTPEGQNPPAQIFNLENTGDQLLNFTITDPETWLNCTPPAGALGAGENTDIAVNLTTAALAPGTYNTTITINGSGASNTPQTVAVTVTVTAASIITLTPATLNASCLEGTNAASQSFVVQNTGSRPLDFTITTDAGWLTCTPATGTISPPGNTPITVTVDYASAALAAGQYRGVITVSDPGAVNSPQTVIVRLLVYPVPQPCNVGMGVIVEWDPATGIVLITGDDTNNIVSLDVVEVTEGEFREAVDEDLEADPPVLASPADPPADGYYLTVNGQHCPEPPVAYPGSAGIPARRVTQIIINTFDGNDIISAINEDGTEGLIDVTDEDPPLMYGLDITVDAGPGDDTIFGGHGDDVINGGPGNDFIHGDRGRDTLDGGDDVDILDYRLIGESEVADAEGAIVDLPNDTATDPTFPFMGFPAATTDTLVGTSFEIVYGCERGDVIIGNTDLPNRLYGLEGDDQLTGGSAGDFIFGAEGNDIIAAGEGDNGSEEEPIDGGEGDDIIAAGSGNDWITGGAGNDIITVVGGDNNVFGGDGDDEILTGEGDDIIFGDDGNDEIVSGPATASDPTLDSDAVVGGAGDDTIESGDGVDVVYGDGLDPDDGAVSGNDEIWLGAGDDFAFGGPGDDLIECGSGNDGTADYPIEGNAGNDIIHGRAGNDWIDAGAGDDGDRSDESKAVTGDEGNDTIWGGDGNDYILGGNELSEECLLAPKGRELDPASVQDFFCDVIFGGGGDDLLKGGSGNDFINGGDGNDDIDGEGGSDYVFGGDGDDTVDGGPGSDMVTGNNGADTLRGGTQYGAGDILDYLRDGGPGGVIVDLAAGTATDSHGSEDALGVFDAVRGTNLADTIRGTSARGNVIMGMADDDRLYGGSRSDVIFGGYGDDLIRGEGDRDIVYGESGSDLILGGPGDDILFGDGDSIKDENRDDIADFELGQPNPLFPDYDPDSPLNIIIPWIPDMLPFDPDTGEYTQLITPTDPRFNVGSDYIDGEAGADIIVGGGGSDGLDLITGFDEETGDPIRGQDEKFDPINGGDGADLIFGDLHIPLGKPPFFPETSSSAGNDYVTGGAGADVIYGCGGMDHLFGDLMDPETGKPLEADPTEGLAWIDRIFGDYDYDYLDREGISLAREKDDGIWEIDPTAPATLAIYKDWIYGGEGDDWLFGGAGNDVLVGGRDDDVIQGNAGYDEIFGGNDEILGYDYKDFSPRDTVDYSTASQWFHRGVMVMLGGNTEYTARTFEMGEAADDGDPTGYGFGTGSDTIYGIENVIGSDFDDVIIGSSEVLADLIALEAIGAGYVGYYMQNYIWVAKDYSAGVNINPLYHYQGNFANILFGRGGNDIIMGRGGEDLVIGGLGNDIMCGDSDIHCDPDGDDPDVVALVTLPPGFGLDLKPQDAAAGGNDYLFGEWGNDKLYGNGGDDLVRGGPGADTLSGGLGMDLLDYSDFPALTPVVVNLRSTPVDLETLEQELIDDPAVLPARLTALTPLPLAPCSNENTVQCPGSASDGGDPGVPGAIPAIPPTPRSVDSIINTPPDDLATPDWDESRDRLEIVLGTHGSDLILGSESKACMLIGWSGDDVLIGSDSIDPNDRLSTSYNPVMYDDIIFGDGPGGDQDNPMDLLAIRFLPSDLGGNPQGGDDLIEGGKGDDYLDGGPHLYAGKGDFLAYSHTQGAVTVELGASHQQNTVSAGWDTIQRFESLIGSNHDDPNDPDDGDVLIGNELSNQIFGLKGDDWLSGGPGDDSLMGGLGEDTADYQSCVNCIDPAEFTVTEDPATGTFFVSNDGQEGSDTLSGVELVLGPAGPIDLTAGTGGGGGGGGGGTVPAPQLQIVLGVLGEIQITQPGGQAEIQFSASGGVGPYTAKWDPMTDTDPENPSRKVTILTYAGGSFAAGQIQTATASPVRDTSYRLTVTDKLGTVKTAFVKVKVAAAFSVFAGVDRIISSGQQITLIPTVTGGVAPYTYSWEAQGTGDGGFVSAKNIPAVTVAPTDSTAYVLTVTDSIGSTATDWVVVTVFGSDVVPVTPDGGGDTTNPDNNGTDTNPTDGGGTGDNGGNNQNGDGADNSISGSPVRLPLPICGAGANLTLVMAGLFMLAVMKRREW